MSGSKEFTDTVTALAAQNLDALAQAGTYLITPIASAMPGTSASLTVAQPAIDAVINPASGAAQYVAGPAQNLTLTASSDNYVDLTMAGSYTVSAVAINASAPSQAANTLRLYKMATGASSAPNAPVGLASNNPLTGSMLQHGIRQTATAMISADQANIGGTSGWTTWADSNFQGVTLPSALQAGGKVAVRLMGAVANQSANTNALLWRLNINAGAAYIYLGQNSMAGNGIVAEVGGAGAYTPAAYPFALSSATLEYQAVGTGVDFQSRAPQSSFTWSAMYMEIYEIA